MELVYNSCKYLDPSSVSVAKAPRFDKGAEQKPAAINLGQPPPLPSAPSVHSPHPALILGKTSWGPTPIPIPLGLHNNGTGSYPGNWPFISCVIKKMYFPSLFCPLFHVFVFFGGIC